MTLDVLKLLKFNEMRLLQSENISSIFMTFDVSKYDKSIDVNEIQEENILPISTTEDVIILLRLILSRFEQLKNINFIDLTLEVSNFDKSISIIFSKESNIPPQYFKYLFHTNDTLFVILLSI